MNIYEVFVWWLSAVIHTSINKWSIYLLFCTLHEYFNILLLSTFHFHFVSGGRLWNLIFTFMFGNNI